VTEGLWDGIVSELRPGDVVLIQFGHNDGGAINDPERARGSLPGLGGETQEIDNLQTSRHEVVHTSDEGARLNAGLVAQGFMVLREEMWTPWFSVQGRSLRRPSPAYVRIPAVRRGDVRRCRRAHDLRRRRAQRAVCHGRSRGSAARSGGRVPALGLGAGHAGDHPVACGQSRRHVSDSCPDPT
jgi:hypothetical protein